MNERQKSLFKEWVIPIFIVGILWVTGWYNPVISFAQRMVLATGIIKPDTSLSPKKEYKTANYAWDLVSMNGERTSLKEFKGKVVFLNFFATWCPPCIAEMPGIDELYQDTSSEDIVFIILSRDESIEKTRNFMAKKGYNMPVFFSAGPIPSEFTANVLPTTYIISPQGQIVSEHRGMADYNNAKVRDFLKELAAQAP